MRLNQIAHPTRPSWRASLLSALSMIAMIALTFSEAADSAEEVTAGDDGTQVAAAAKP